MTIDGIRARKIHIVGIKGVAMTALAAVLRDAGAAVTGSDVADEFPTDEILTQLGIVPEIGFSPRHVQPGTDLVVYTGAHGGRENPEVMTARSKGVPVYPHGEALGKLMRKYRQVTIAGCHGKTTTTALTATIAVEAGLHPSYAIGCGVIFGLGLPGRADCGEFFIAEGDEYMTDPGHDNTPRMYWQQPEILAITNVDYDHPDRYRDVADVRQSFQTYIRNNRKLQVLILNADDTESVFSDIGQSREVLTFGFGKSSRLRVTDVRDHDGTTDFSCTFEDKPIGRFATTLSGEHNVRNSLAAILCGYAMGLSWDTIRMALPKFRGTKRRLETIADTERVVFIDDYAHHPTEITATLSALRHRYDGRALTIVFQPHTYSRTKSLLEQFATCFRDADTVIITDIYASKRETPDPDFSGEHLANAIRNTHPSVQYAPGPSDVLSILSDTLGKNAVCVFAGAGDIYTWGKAIAGTLTGRYSRFPVEKRKGNL